MRSLIVTLASLATLLTLATSASAHAPGASDWSWTPALCKSTLKQYGVEIDDGRTFRAASVFCAGLPKCTYSRSGQVFYYDHFVVAMIDNNLVYRTMRLHVTGKYDFRADNLRVYGSATTTAELAAFKREARALTTGIAKKTQAYCSVEK